MREGSPLNMWREGGREPAGQSNFIEWDGATKIQKHEYHTWGALKGQGALLHQKWHRSSKHCQVVWPQQLEPSCLIKPWSTRVISLTIRVCPVATLEQYFRQLTSQHWFNLSSHHAYRNSQFSLLLCYSKQQWKQCRDQVLCIMHSGRSLDSPLHNQVWHRSITKASHDNSAQVCRKAAIWCAARTCFGGSVGTLGAHRPGRAPEYLHRDMSEGQSVSASFREHVSWFFVPQ